MAIYKITPERERPRGWEILSLGDIAVFVEPSFLFFMGFIILTGLQNVQDTPEAQTQMLTETGLFGFIIFFSLLAHEAGHAVMARLLGYRDITISLIFMGGVTRHPPSARGHSLAITLAGPAMTLALVGIAWGLLSHPPTWMQLELCKFIFRNIFALNLFWAIFNLLPIFPMDGGRSVLLGLSFLMRDARAFLTTAFISLAACAGIVIFMVYLRATNRGGGMQSSFFLIYFLVTFVQANVQIIRSQWGRW